MATVIAGICCSRIAPVIIPSRAAGASRWAEATSTGPRSARPSATALRSIAPTVESLALIEILRDAVGEITQFDPARWFCDKRRRRHGVPARPPLSTVVVYSCQRPHPYNEMLHIVRGYHDLSAIPIAQQYHASGIGGVGAEASDPATPEPPGNPEEPP